MSEKPVWFLDIDGVINSWPKPPEDTGWEFKNVTILGYSIWYTPELIEWIDRLHESGDVEVRWLTTWEHRANDSFAPEVGFRNRFKVHENPHPHSYGGGPGWWKADVVEMFRQSHPDTPIIWTDDDISFYQGFAGRALGPDADAVVICPVSNEGLTADHLDLIAEFAEEFR
jgi:hypothetical protein